MPWRRSPLAYSTAKWTSSSPSSTRPTAVICGCRRRRSEGDTEAPSSTGAFRSNAMRVAMSAAFPPRERFAVSHLRAISARRRNCVASVIVCSDAAPVLKWNKKVSANSAGVATRERSFAWTSPATDMDGRNSVARTETSKSTEQHTANPMRGQGREARWGG